MAFSSVHLLWCLRPRLGFSDHCNLACELSWAAGTFFLPSSVQALFESLFKILEYLPNRLFLPVLLDTGLVKFANRENDDIFRALYLLTLPNLT